jgi:hypothetical protein
MEGNASNAETKLSLLIGIASGPGNSEMDLTGVPW